MKKPKTTNGNDVRKCFFAFVALLLVLGISDYACAQQSVMEFQLEDKIFYIGEKVEIDIKGDFSSGYSLEIVSDKKVYSYVGVLKDTVYFYPEDEGAYVVNLFFAGDGSSKRLIKSQSFSVLEFLDNNGALNETREEDAKYLENSSGKINYSDSGKLIFIEKEKYNLGEEIIISLGISEEQKSDYELYYQFMDSIYKYNRELNEDNIRFTPPVPGTYDIILKDVSGKEIESKEINVIDDEEFQQEILGSEEIIEYDEFKESDEIILLRNKLTITDRSGNAKDYAVKKAERSSGLHSASPVLKSAGKTEEGNPEYNVEIELRNSIVKRISLSNLVIDNDSIGNINLGLEELSPNEITNIDNGRRRPVKAFGIDPSLLSFESGNISVIASGSELWKCQNWSFAEQECHGEWVKIKDIIPGREYLIEISPEDPGYAETGLATVNTNKSIYHTNEPAEIIVVVLDSSGYLVENASVALEVWDPLGNPTIFSTQEGNLFQTERGIYRAYYVGTSMEGIYSLVVNAIGIGVNSSMMSQFEVRDYYEFDILRNAPVTIDPWIGPFNSSIKVISYVDIPFFNLSETIPLDLVVINSGGAEENIVEGARVLTWVNLSNNSEITYTVQAPLRTPDLIIIGKAVINYVFDSAARIFEEIKTWFIAVDPVVTRDQGLVVFADRTNDGYIKYRNWTGSLLQSEVNSNIDIIDRISWQDFRCLVGFTNCIYAGSDTGDDINFATFDTNTWTWGNYTQMDSSSLDDQRNFDIECESLSGTCLVVYEDSTGGDANFILRTWNGSSLSGTTSVSVSGGENDDFRWITLYPKKDSDVMGIMLQNQGGGTGGTPAIYAGIWNGSSFGNWQTLTTNGPSQNNERTNYRHADCAWEGSTGKFICAYGTNGNSQIDAYSFNGSSWTSLGNIYGGPSDEVLEIVLCGQNADSSFNHSFVGIMMCDADSDLDGGIWNGSSFSKTAAANSPAENTNAECGPNKDAAHYALNFGCEWEESGNQAVFLWVDNNNDYLTYGTYLVSTSNFTNPNWDSGTQIVADGAGDIRQTDLIANPASDEIFLVYTDGSRDGGCSLWTGSVWNGAGCNNSAVFETSGPNVGVGWMTFDWFRNPPPQPEITIISPSDIYAQRNYSGIISPSSTSIAWDGSITAYPVSGANAPIAGVEVSSSGYYDMSSSNDVRYTTTISGAPTGRYAYQSFNFSIVESTVNMRSLVITHEGYATQGTALSSSGFQIYVYNWSADRYVLMKTVYPSTIDVTSEISITSGFTDFVRNRNLYVLVGGNFSLGIGGNARADINTDYIGVAIENIPMLSQNITVNASAVDDDGVSKCEWVFYNTTGGMQTNLTGMTNSGGIYYYNRSVISLIPDGFYNLTVFCNDTISARTNASIYVYVDNTKPEIRLYSPGNNSNMTVNYAVFSWNVTDIPYETLSCNVTIDNVVRGTNIVSAHGENTSKNISSISDGTHYWNVTCVDDAGNRNTSQTWKFDSDTSAPSISLNYPAHSSYTSKSPLDLNFTASDSHSIVNCSLYLDGSLNRTLYNITSGALTNVTIYNLAQGNHYWNVTCIDVFGLRGYSVQRNFTYDLVAPAVYLNITSGFIFNGTSPVLNYTVIDNIDSNMTCNITVNSVVELSNIGSLNNTLVSRNVPLLDGYKQWYVTCVDDAGNVNTSETRLFQVVGGPLVSLSSPSNGSVSNGSNVQFRYYAIDGNGVDNCSLYINGILNQTNTSISNGANNTFIVANINEGVYNWSVVCYDSSGYPGNSQTWRYVSDRSKPTITLLMPTNGQVINTTTTYFNFTFTDAFSPNATCNLSIDGNVSSSNQNFIAVNGSTTSRSQVVINGLHYWNVTCTDLGNNSNYSETWSFTVNATFPVGVTVIADKVEYQEGEVAYVNITTRNQSNGLISANFTLDYIYTNNTYTDVPWWNTSWKYRKPIIINQTNNTAINEKAILLNVTVPYGTIADCDELRVITDSDMTSVNFTILSGNDVTYCYIYFVGSVSANALNENNYHIYYGNTGVAYAGGAGYLSGNLIVEYLFYDNFDSGSLSNWNANAGWDVSSGDPLTGNHAHIDGGVTNSAIATSSYFYLSRYDFVNLSFTYGIDGSWDGTEYLRYYYTNNSGSSWTQVGGLTGGAGALTQSISSLLNSSYKKDGFNLRFMATVSDGGEDGGFDNVNITGTFMVQTSINASVGNHQEHILRLYNTTNSSGMYISNFTTTERTYGNYSSVVYAYPSSSTLRAGTGYDWFSIIKDSFGPVITLYYPGNGATIRSGNITFNYTAVDYANNVQNCSLYINGLWNQSTPNGTLVNESIINNFTTNLYEGNYTWFVNCFDTLGASVNSSVRSLIIDDTSPSVIALTPNNTMVASGKVVFTFNITDNYDTSIYCNLSVDNGVYSSAFNASNGIGSANISNISDGQHYWNITCFDNANNNATSHTLNFTAANIPVVTLHSPQDGYGVNSTNITLYYNLSSSNIVNCSLILNGTYNQTVTAAQIPYINNDGQNSFNLTGLNYGVYNWTVLCIDSNNFNGSAAARTFQLDNAAPNITLIYPENNQTVYSRNINFTFNTTDADDVLLCNLTIDGIVNKSNQNITSGKVGGIYSSGLSISDHNWSITCVDNTGFITTTETRNFTIDSNVNIVLSNPPNNYFTNAANINLTYIPSSPADFAFGFCDLYIDSAVYATHVALTSGLPYTFQVVGLGQDTYSWYVNCTDSVGKEGISEIRTFTIDMVPPVVNTHYPDSNIFSNSGVTFNWSVTDNIDSNLTCSVTVNGTVQSPSNINSPNNTVVNRTYSGFTDGLLFWNVTCIDDAGNRATSGLKNFTVQEAPVIALGSPANTTRGKNQNITFYYTPSDNSGLLSSCSIFLDGMINQTNTSGFASGIQRSFIILDISAGNHTWYINCTDPMGNTGYSNVHNFYVDLYPPVIVLDRPYDGEYVNGNNVLFNLTATDYPGTSINCSLYVDTNFRNSSFMLSGLSFNMYVYNLSDGPHSWSVNCSDNLNNSVMSETRNFIINQPDLYVDNTRIRFNNTNPDIGSIINITVNVSNLGGVPANNAVVEFWDGDPSAGGTFIGAETGTISFNSSRIYSVNWTIGGGYHTIYALLDPSGAISELSEVNNNATSSISVLRSVINYPYNNSMFGNETVSVNFTLQDYTGGLINYTVFVNGIITGQTGQVNDNVLSLINVTFLQGIRTVMIRATDNLSRMKNSSFVTVTIDYTPPQPVILTQNNTWYNYTTPIVNITATDNIDNMINFTIYVNGTPDYYGNISNNSNMLVSLNPLSEGMYRLIMEAFDNLNNTANSTVRQIYVDLTSPSITLNSPQDGENFSSRNVFLNYSVYDALSSQMYCNLTLDGAIVDSKIVQNGNSTAYAAINLAEGTHYWSVVCRDMAYNIRVSEARNFNVYMAPNIQLVSPQNNYWSKNSTNTFYFNVSDETGITNCSLLLNNSIMGTKYGGDILVNSTNNISISGMNGQYLWAVECYDNTTYAAYNISSNRTIYVDTQNPSVIIYTQNDTWFNTSPIIYFNLTDNMDSIINYTVFINGSLNISGTSNNGQNSSATLSGLLDGSYEVVIQGTDEALNSFNGSPIIINVDTIRPTIMLLYPLNDSNLSVASTDLNFTAYDNSGRSMVCNMTLDNVSVVVNRLVSNGEIVNYTAYDLNGGYHYWNVSCIDVARNRNVSETRIFYILRPDIYINASRLVFNDSEPRENDTVSISALIENIGTTDAADFMVEFWEGTPGAGGKLIGSGISINLTSGESRNLTVNYTATLGTMQIWVIADRANVILEENELNNNASGYIVVGLWHYAMGNTKDRLVITDAQLGLLFDWELDNSTNSNIFVVDSDSDINWRELQALGRDISNSSAFNDFAELDVKLNSTGFADSINSTYTTGGAVKEVSSFIIYSKSVNNVPVVNSTDNSNFKTGILWDYGDGNTEYNGTQDIVFLTKMQNQLLGYNTTNYDYEIRIPATLRSYVGPTLDSVEFYMELK